MERIIERTEDGSATLFVPELNEHYHSTKGARTESQHIFIDMGLKASAAPSPHILEIGFGTGLNAWLTLKEAEESCRNVHYTGVKLYPLEWQTIEQLNYVPNDEQITVNNSKPPSSCSSNSILLHGKRMYGSPRTSPYEKYKRTLISGK